MKRSRAKSNSSLAPIVIAGIGGGLVGLLISMVVLSSQGQTTSLKMLLFGSSGVVSAALGVSGYCMLKQQHQRLNSRLQALEAKPVGLSEVRSDRASATDLAMIKPVDYGTAVGATQTLLVADAMGELHQRRLEAGYPPLDVTTILQPMTSQEAEAEQCYEQDQEALADAVQKSIPEPARDMVAATNGANGAADPHSTVIQTEEEMVQQAVMGSEPELEATSVSNDFPLEGDRGKGDSNGAAVYSSNAAVGLDHDPSGDAWGNSSSTSQRPLGFY